MDRTIREKVIIRLFRNHRSGCRWRST